MSEGPGPVEQRQLFTQGKLLANVLWGLSEDDASLVPHHHGIITMLLGKFIHIFMCFPFTYQRDKQVLTNTKISLTLSNTTNKVNMNHQIGYARQVLLRVVYHQ